MKTDLRNFATTAESMFASDGSFANVVVPSTLGRVMFTAVLGVTDWTATATHANMPGVVCTLSVGLAVEGRGPNEPACQ